MKLVAIKQARSIWLANVVDLNPRGIDLMPLIAPIVRKYDFKLYPNKPEELFGKDVREIKFSGGSFQQDIKKQPINIDLTIYNDGFVVDTRSSTKDSDAFLSDLLTWVSTEFNLVPYQEVLRSQIYLSELWVQMHKNMNSLNPKLKIFAEKITSLTKSHIHHNIAFETSGIIFWTDPTMINPPNPFRLERIIDRPFSENRYYSAAPLQTEVHLELLDELEKIFED